MNNFNCVVGKNDVGKSTILRAINHFLNDINLTEDDINFHKTGKILSITIRFDVNHANIEK